MESSVCEVPYLTIASRPTAARQRFLLNLKKFVWAAEAEAKRWAADKLYDDDEE